MGSQMTPALEVRGLTKYFGQTCALSGVDFTLREAEIHALLGENGAGKSTFIKILAGLETADGGSITFGGAAGTEDTTSSKTRPSRIRFVHQDLGLLNGMSVLDNIALGTCYYKGRLGLIDFRRTGKWVRDCLRRLDVNINPDMLVGALTQAERVTVAIARAIADEARILVLDEITASLPAPDASRVLQILRTARAHGTSIIYVTHRLDDLDDFCDWATVLADGRMVFSEDFSRVGRPELVRWIAGKEVEPSCATPEPLSPPAECALSVKNLFGAALNEPISFDVARGEILGLTGLLGSGYEAAARLLSGELRAFSGSVTLDGIRLPLTSTAGMRKRGFSLITGDREAAAFPSLSVRENFFPYRRLRRWSNERGEVARSKELEARVKVRPRGSTEKKMAALSGGNQQKVLFGRALSSSPRSLLLVDPTAGVDIAARDELYSLLRQEALRGCAIILASSDFEEIERLTHRTLVFSRGRVATQLIGSEVKQNRLVREAIGHNIERSDGND